MLDPSLKTILSLVLILCIGCSTRASSDKINWTIITKHEYQQDFELRLYQLLNMYKFSDSDMIINVSSSGSGHTNDWKSTTFGFWGEIEGVDYTGECRYIYVNNEYDFFSISITHDLKIKYLFNPSYQIAP